MMPLKNDLFEYVQAEITVKEVTKVNQLIGIGTTTNKFIDMNGVTYYFTCE